MNDRQIGTVEDQIREALGEDELTRIGIETGFTKRLRDVTPFRLILAVVGAMACRRMETIADPQRGFHATTGRRVEYKPFHNQLAEEAFPVFMKSVFEGLLGRLAVRTLAPIPGHELRRFQRAHPLRDRSTGRLASGLRPTHLNARLATCVVKD